MNKPTKTALITLLALTFAPPMASADSGLAQDGGCLALPDFLEISAEAEVTCLKTPEADADPCPPVTVAHAEAWTFDLNGIQDPPLGFYLAEWTQTTHREAYTYGSSTYCYDVSRVCNLQVSDGSHFEMSWVRGANKMIVGEYKGIAVADTSASWGCSSSSASFTNANLAGLLGILDGQSHNIQLTKL